MVGMAGVKHQQRPRSFCFQSFTIFRAAEEDKGQHFSSKNTLHFRPVQSLCGKSMAKSDDKTLFQGVKLQSGTAAHAGMKSYFLS